MGRTRAVRGRTRKIAKPLASSGAMISRSVTFHAAWKDDIRVAPLFFSASKRLESLVNHDLNLLEKICKRLDKSVPGCHNYEVIAQHFRFDYWTIKSDFEEHKEGSSKAMILSIISRYPKVTVEKFASVVEEKTRRCDVAELLREYDLREDEDDFFEN